VKNTVTPKNRIAISASSKTSNTFPISINKTNRKLKIFD